MKPNTRIDNFLAKIAGDPDANEAMIPRSPEEYYLDQIAQNGGGGGGGGGSSVMELHMDENLTLDKTWQEINDAMLAGTRVFMVATIAEEGITTICDFLQIFNAENTFFGVTAFALRDINDYFVFQPLVFMASSANAYPVLNTGE